MKIATFNVNDVNKRRDNLLVWLARAAPDVVCLQELKCEARAFPHDALRAAGYAAVVVGQRTWNGVAILAREASVAAAPVVTRTALPGDADDGQARYIEAAVGGILVASIYAPYGNPRPGPKFDYKLAWLERLIAHAAELVAAGVPVVLAGDFNVAPGELDIYPTRSYRDDALVHPASREAFSRLVAQGWTDALRAMRPETRVYTFWSYLRDRFARDAGLRLDHLLVGAALAPRLVAAGVDRDTRGAPDASDHAPVWIELAS